jgi:predicted short-subunit dehydrogenase-like oxidoreductase (DUF2520 family)
MGVRPSVTIIGAGAVGTAWLDLFETAGYPVWSVFHSDSGTLFNSSTGLKQATGSHLPADDSQAGDWVFITTPDDSIQSIAKKLSETSIDWSGRYVIHCSGSHDASLLDPLKSRGARTLSVHPIQTFQKGDGSDRFRQIYISLEGDQEAVNNFKPLIESFQSTPIVLTADQKRTVHIAAVFASNYLVGLLNEADGLLTDSGIEDGIDLLKPLVKQTVNNIFEKGLKSSLTGPISRSDSTTVENHLKQLKTSDELSSLYRALGRACLKIAQTDNRGRSIESGLLEKLLKP